MAIRGGAGWRSRWLQEAVPPQLCRQRAANELRTTMFGMEVVEKSCDLEKKIKVRDGRRWTIDRPSTSVTDFDFFSNSEVLGASERVWCLSEPLVASKLSLESLERQPLLHPPRQQTSVRASTALPRGSAHARSAGMAHPRLPAARTPRM